MFQSSEYPALFRLVLCAFCLLGSLGCSRSRGVEFSADADFAELPELHQKNITDGLLRLFGNAENPRQRIPDPDAEDPEEGETVPLIEVADEDHLKHGATVYNARCAGCHGVTGDGLGPAGLHLRPRPRDYRRGIFKFTSTEYGWKPARHDLVRTVRRGAKGTSMPAFPWMAEENLDAVIDYVIYLSQRGEVERNVIFMSGEYDEDEEIEFVDFTDALESSRESWAEAEDNVVLPATAEPRYEEESVVIGRKLFLSKGCSSCHGEDGKGQVDWLNPEFLAKQESLPEEQRVRINVDAWNEPAPAADLTARMLHGGRRPIDIYRRIYTGINGTPMPAFVGVFVDDPESIWHLVHYVRHVIEGGDPLAGIPSLPKETESTDSTDPQADDSTGETSPEEQGDEDTPDEDQPDEDQTENEEQSEPVLEPAA